MMHKMLKTLIRSRSLKLARLHSLSIEVIANALRSGRMHHRSKAELPVTKLE